MRKNIKLVAKESPWSKRDVVVMCSPEYTEPHCKQTTFTSLKWDIHFFYGAVSGGALEALRAPGKQTLASSSKPKINFMLLY